MDDKVETKTNSQDFEDNGKKFNGIKAEFSYDSNGNPDHGNVSLSPLEAENAAIEGCRARTGYDVVRIDNPHGKIKTHHINVNETVTGVKDPHMKISPGTFRTLKAGGGTLDALGKIAKPVAIATDALRLGVAVQQDGGTIGENTITTAGSVAGGWVGASAGAVLGAKGGAAVGTLVVPGVGTAIGGLVGGFGGGIIGAFLGSEAGGSAARSVVPLVKEEDK